MMCEDSKFDQRKKKHEKGSMSKLSTKSRHWKHLTSYIDDVWSVGDSQFQVCVASKMIHLTTCWLTHNVKTKLTLSIDDEWVTEPHFHQRKWYMKMNHLASYQLIYSRTGINLQAVLMAYKLLIHSFHKKWCVRNETFHKLLITSNTKR